MLLENCGYRRDDRVRREAKTLAAAGYEVSVICPGTRGEPRSETVDGVRVDRFPAPRRPAASLGYVWEYGYSLCAVFLLTLVRALNGGFDVIHAHQPPDAFAVIAGFFKMFGKTYVADHHDLAPELYRARFRGRGQRAVFWILACLEKMAFRFADRVIATNQSYREIEVSRDGVAAESIAIVRNGPDLSEIRPLPPDAELRTRAAVILGYVGVTGIQDGVDRLLGALSALRTAFGKTDFLCVIVGAGHALEELKAMTRRLDLSSSVLFTGWVDDPAAVSRYLSSMDICLAPEPSDPYNDRSTAAKLMEYMAVGKPIVAFDLPEHRRTAREAAVYARPNDEMDFARNIAVLMDDEALRRELGRMGRDRIERDLHWGRQAEILLGLYDGLRSPLPSLGAMAREVGP